MDWKSEQETVIMEYFRELCPDFPPGRLLKHEAPDFILAQGRRKNIGIELTQIHDPDHAQNGTSVIGLKSGIDQVMHCIQEKADKLPAYQNPDIGSIWLLITADEAPAHFTRHLSDYLTQHPIESGFNRIYLFILLNKTILQIR